MKINKVAIVLIGAVAAFTACTKNQAIDYSDYKYQTVYFALQYVPRTIELGEDEFVDNSLDNQHKVMINATLGGVRDNKKDVTVGIAVDTSLCNRLYFPNNGPKITPLPPTYYKLASNQITIPSGSIMGGVQVELTDAFFADPLSVNNTYALPLVLSDIKGADSVLRGEPFVAGSNPDRTNTSQWSVQPRDYVVYGVKYVNQWHGNYLRRGVDVATGSQNGTIVRHKTYVEQDEVNKLSTTLLSQIKFPVTVKDSSNYNVNFDLLLTFDASGNCSITSTTPNTIASGSGKFVSKGEKKSWGDKDRDALYLDYAVNITYTPPSSISKSLQVATKDTLVMRDRAVGFEIITPVYK
jgi:hypothetical protein